VVFQQWENVVEEWCFSNGKMGRKWENVLLKSGVSAMGKWGKMLLKSGVSAMGKWGKMLLKSGVSAMGKWGRGMERKKNERG
jgi:hypothetical protein